MSLFRSCWAVLNCAFQLSSFLSFLRIGTQALIYIFFCPITFLPTISAYRVELQPVTVASQKLHTTLLALPRLLWTQASEHPCKSSEWLLLKVQQLQGPLSNHFVIEHFSYFAWLEFKINFWLQNKWMDQNVNIYTLWHGKCYCVLKIWTEIP